MRTSISMERYSFLALSKLACLAIDRDSEYREDEQNRFFICFNSKR